MLCVIQYVSENVEWLYMQSRCLNVGVALSIPTFCVILRGLNPVLTACNVP